MLRDLAEELARNGPARAELDTFSRHAPYAQRWATSPYCRAAEHLFDEHVFVSTALESTAVAAAGLAKKSLYELEPGEVPRESWKRALERMDSVNAEILTLIHKSWGRA